MYHNLLVYRIPVSFIPFIKKSLVLTTRRPDEPHFTLK